MEDNAHLFSDGVGGRNLASRKENGASQVSEKGVSLSSSVAIQDTRSKEAISAARFYIFYGLVHSEFIVYSLNTKSPPYGPSEHPLAFLFLLWWEKCDRPILYSRINDHNIQNYLSFGFYPITPYHVVYFNFLCTI